MRLIDADVLRDLIDGGYDIDFSETPELKRELLNMVDYQETVDAVPVVRCKDCQYSREPNRHDRDEKAACEGVLICCVGFDHVYPSAYDGLLFTDESDYCSKGERREEEQDEGQ